LRFCTIFVIQKTICDETLLCVVCAFASGSCTWPSTYVIVQHGPDNSLYTLFTINRRSPAGLWLVLTRCSGFDSLCLANMLDVSHTLSISA